MLLSLRVAEWYGYSIIGIYQLVNRKFGKYQNIFKEVFALIERIVSLMDKRGVNGSQLTTELGIANSSVTDWKKGKSRPGIETIVKLADYFGVTTDYLLRGDEQGANAPIKTKGGVVMSSRILSRKDVRDAIDRCLRSSIRHLSPDGGMPTINADNPVDDELAADIAERARITVKRITGFILLAVKDIGGEEEYPTAGEYKAMSIATGKFNDESVKGYQELFDAEAEQLAEWQSQGVSEIKKGTYA